MTTNVSAVPLRSWLIAAAGVLLVLASLVPGRAIAQPPGDEPAVKIRAVPRFPAAAAGGELVIAVEMDHGSAYHSWPAEHVKLPKDVDEFAIRTEIGLARDDDGKPVVPDWLEACGGTQYPEAKVGKAPDPTGQKDTIDVPLYAKKAVSYVALRIRPDAKTGEQTARIRVAYQACDDSMCFAPEDVTLAVRFRIVAAGSTDLGQPNEPALFEAYDAGKLTSPEDRAAQSPQNPGGAGPGAAAGAPPTRVEAGAASLAPGATLFGVNLGSNVVIIALASMLGGFILCLTPCVLPVIPIKVLTLNKHAGSRRRAIVLGLWMAAGVVAFWTAIGVPMAFISKTIDPSQYIFGTWWVTFGIGVAIAVLSLGLMGLFTLSLPQSVYMVESKADSPMGSFGYGILTAILGLPCFGFVAGGLLAAATALPATTIMVIFVGLGVGMAAPYLVLSIFPNLLKFMPKTGPASNLVKQVMGLLLLAAAAFFVAAGIQALLKERPYLAGSMTWWAVGFFVLVASLWMVIRTWQIAKAHWPKVVMPLLAVAMCLGIGVFAQGRLDHDRAAYLAREAAFAQARGRGAASGDVAAGVWLPYTPELFSAVRAVGRPVFLDFTADWCITCKALKAALLEQEPLKSAFKDRGVVLMEVDCTVRNGPGSRMLRELGRIGVPTWAIYGAGSDRPRFVPVDKPTPGTVIAELDAAGAKPPVATR